MKKSIIVMFLFIFLVGCQNEITTFDEIIRDDQVEIDGIEYEIYSVKEESYKYNRKDLKTETDMGNLKIKYIYDNGLLIQTNNFVNDKNTASVEYHYKAGKLIRQDTISDTLSQYTEYKYDDNLEYAMYYDKDDTLIATIIHIYDDKGMILYRETIWENQSNYFTQFYYKEDLLDSKTGYRDDQVHSIYNYEYNNLGDEIMEYRVVYDNEMTTLVVTFTEYEYNNKHLPIKKTIYTVWDSIEEVNIRKFD